MVDFQIVEQCPLCQGSNSSPQFAKPVYVGKRTVNFTYRECVACQTLFVAEKIEEENSVDQYQGNYLHGSNTKKGLATQAADWYSEHRFQYEFTHDIQVTGLRPGSRIIDFGSGYGQRVRLMRRLGFDAMGLEPYYMKADDQENKFFQSLASLKESLGNRQVDMLQLNHVFGHLHQPLQELAPALELVRPGGFLVMRNPNPLSWQLRFFRENWSPIDPTRIFFLAPCQAIVQSLSVNGWVSFKEDHHFDFLHPPTFVLSAFPHLDPLSPKTGTIGKALWAAATLTVGLPLKFEQWLKSSGIYTLYLRKEIVGL